MRLKNITFTLENCDTITIDGKYIGNIQCSDISQKLMRIANNSVDCFDCCDMFFIEINRDANIKKKPFDCNELEEYEIFSRLTKSQDIIYISITLFDNSNNKEYFYKFCVNWNDIDENDNSYQTYYISDLGNLFLMVNKSLNVLDYIDIDRANDVEMNDIYWDMLQ